jgi:2-C-methyl-D-erythritol 4-phosphate cytidylyltransferase
VEVWTIVLAAGAGTRFGGAKQFGRLGERRVVDLAVETAASCSDGVVVVVPPEHRWTGSSVHAAVAGGATRSASVRAGLASVPETAEVILVHDAARPLASRSLFDAVIAAVAGGAEGAVPALPVTDTIKRVAEGRVVETVARSDLVTVQTPQAFRAEALRRAHAGGGDDTDDAALVEAAGGTVVVVPGEESNLKVTTAVDLDRAAGMVKELR